MYPLVPVLHSLGKNTPKRGGSQCFNNETINHHSSDILITLGNVTLLIVLFSAKVSNERKQLEQEFSSWSCTCRYKQSPEKKGRRI